MNFLEKNLEDLIWENQKTQNGRHLLSERGLDINGKAFRQFKLGAYGIADIVTFTLNGREKNFKDDSQPVYYYVSAQIFELKKSEVTLSTISQVLRYCNGIHHFFENWFDNVKKNQNDKFVLNIEPILIGSQIHDDAVWVIGHSNVSVFKYSFDLESGLKFKEVGHDENTRYTTPKFDLDIKMPHLKNFIYGHIFKSDGLPF